jgi:hypothetical protein
MKCRHVPAATATHCGDSPPYTAQAAQHPQYNETACNKLHPVRVCSRQTAAYPSNQRNTPCHQSAHLLNLTQCQPFLTHATPPEWITLRCPASLCPIISSQHCACQAMQHLSTTTVSVSLLSFQHEFQWSQLLPARGSPGASQLLYNTCIMVHATHQSRDARSTDSRDAPASLEACVR